MTDATRLGQFELLESLHRGPGAEVWLARYSRNGRPLLAAVKRLTPEAEADVEWRAALLAGARASAGLLHPNIVRVLEVGQGGAHPREGPPYVALEYVSGQSVRAMRELASRQAQPLPVQVAALLGAQVCGAL